MCYYIYVIWLGGLFMNKLKLAYNLARYAHKGQVDLAGVDYFEHPKQVARLVKGRNAKIVALLHDTVEDTFVTLDLLKALGFSQKIIDAVDAITHIKAPIYEPYPDYIKRCKKNKIATRVKIADMQHNSDLSRLSKPSDKDIKRSTRYMMYIRYLKDVISEINA